MIKFLKREVGELKMFCFTVNGQEPRFDKGTRLLLKVFEQSFGSKFWNHVGVVYTRWGSDTKSVNTRKRFKLTEEGRTEEVRKMLNEECPLSKDYLVPVYFTDTVELVETDGELEAA